MPPVQEIATKNALVEVKDAAKGILSVVFATTGVMDLDGDFISPGAFGEQPVAMSTYGHGWREGNLPIGKGATREDGNKAIADVQLFMEMEAARDHLTVIKEMGALQEYSFGFQVKKTGELTEDMRQRGIWRVIDALRVFEVSPVLLGAGINTGTLSAKNRRAGAEVKAFPVACKCGRRLGESTEQLIYVGQVKECADVKVSPPRDVRHCKTCSQFTVFVPVATLSR